MTGGVDHLDVEDLLETAAGVVGHVVVRDMGLLASAAARPRTTVLGRPAYPGLVDKAAALLHALARNHALPDGNKRLAWAAARVHLLLNGADLAYDVDDAERIVVAAAAGGADVADVAAWIRARLT